MKKIILIALIAMTGAQSTFVEAHFGDKNAKLDFSKLRTTLIGGGKNKNLRWSVPFPKTGEEGFKFRALLAKHFVPTIKRLFKNEKDKFNINRLREPVDQTDIYNSYIGDTNRKTFGAFATYINAQKDSGVLDAIYKYDDKILSKLYLEGKVSDYEWLKKDNAEFKPVNIQFGEKQSKELGYVGGNKLPNPGMFSTLGRISQDLMKSSFVKITTFCTYFR